jgi:hypothetical protein
MRKLLILLSLLATSVQAADLTPKTAATTTAAVTGYPYTACGAYFGLDTQAVTGSTSEGEVGGLVGYSCPLGSSGFWFVEGMFNFANLNSTTGGLNLTGPLSLEQRLAVGGPLATLWASLYPSGLTVPTLPVLPTGVTVTTAHPYTFVSIHEQDISASIGVMSNREWEISPGFGIGMLNQLSNGIALDVFAEAQFQQKAACLPQVCTGMGTLYRLGLAAKY